MSTHTKEPFCANCNRTPDQISEYEYAAEAEDLTPAEYVWQEEGTLDRATGAFLCTQCYYELGQPSGPHGWTATDENLVQLRLGEHRRAETKPAADILRKAGETGNDSAVYEGSLAEFRNRLRESLDL